MNELIAYLTVPLPEEIRLAKCAGSLDEALRLIELRLAADPPSRADRKNPDPLCARLLLERERIRQLPAEYPFPYHQALSLVREKIPDFTEAEFAAYEEAGWMDAIYRNGEKRYFHLFLDSLLTGCPDFAARCADGDGDPSDKLKKRLTHTRQLKENGSWRAHIRLRASLRPVDEAFRPGTTALVHLALPSDSLPSCHARLLRTSHTPAAVTGADAPARTVAFREHLEENTTFWAEYEYDSVIFYHDLSGALADVWPPLAPSGGCPAETGSAKGLPSAEPRTSDPLDGASAAGRAAADASGDPASLPEPGSRPLPVHGDVTDEDLAELLPHIRFTPYLRRLAADIIDPETDPLHRAWRIYDYITSHIRYSYMPAYFQLDMIPEYCAVNGKGDCGVQALLFITLCRIAGIPARWQSGLHVTPLEAGPHDWAMFYCEPFGWLYADLSFGGAARAAGCEELRRHYFGNLDAFRMVANTAFQADLLPEKAGLRADPYDNQTGECELDGQGLCEARLDTRIQVLSFTTDNPLS